MKTPKTARDLFIAGLALLAFTTSIALMASSCASSASRSSGPSPEIQAPEPAAPGIVVKSLSLHSDQVRAGKVYEGGNLSLAVLLPPSYGETDDTRFPVVYCLHGYGDGVSQLINKARPALRRLWAEKALPEFIMVGIPGTNSLGGSFYADSPATGNWMSMVTEEALPLVDASLRTLPEPGARVLAGFSMGGFGAWNIGLARADLFANVWSCCPGALKDGDLDLAMGTWDSRFMAAYGAAFAPDLGLESPYARIPTQGDGDAGLKVAWYSGFGDIEGKLSAYEAGQARLKSIRFDYGEGDGYTWIPAGTKSFAEAMKAAGLPVEIQGWPSGHDVSTEIAEQGFLPFVVRAFASAQP